MRAACAALVYAAQRAGAERARALRSSARAKLKAQHDALAPVLEEERSRGDLTDWPKAFADSQIVTRQQFDKVKLPDLEAIGVNRRDWTLRWQEIMG